MEKSSALCPLLFALCVTGVIRGFLSKVEQLPFPQQVFSDCLLSSVLTNESNHRITRLDRLRECPPCMFSPAQSHFRTQLLQIINMSRNLDTCLVMHQAVGRIISLWRFVSLHLYQRGTEVETELVIDAVNSPVHARA